MGELFSSGPQSIFPTEVPVPVVELPGPDQRLRKMPPVAQGHSGHQCLPALRAAAQWGDPQRRAELHGGLDHGPAVLHLEVGGKRQWRDFKGKDHISYIYIYIYIYSYTLYIIILCIYNIT